MQTADPQSLRQVLLQLPETCIHEMVAEFKGRPVGVVVETKAKQYFILNPRGMWQTHKHKAVQQFVDWIRVNCGESSKYDKTKKWIIPRGWFAAYARAHPQLVKACNLSATKEVLPTNVNYKRIQRLYSRAFKAFAAEHSTVAERRIVPSAATEFAVAESDPPAVNRVAKFRYIAQRLEPQYFSGDFGVGRKRVCATIREMLIMWYSIIRHSVNVKVMCRFPKKVLLVKALMLHAGLLRFLHTAQCHPGTCGHNSRVAE